MKKKIRGFSLIESMLVMAIAASLLLFAINQYQQYKLQASFLDVKRNVDVLFQALGQYYQANCRSTSDAALANLDGSVVNHFQGDLAPGGIISDFTLSNQSVPIDIQTKLKNSHFLSANWPTYAPLVDTETYSAKFIFLLTTKKQYACWNFKNTTEDLKCNTAYYFPDVASDEVGPTNLPENKVAYWLVQISVRVHNDTTGKRTLAALGPTGANCASGSPDVCDGSDKPTYLIWQQLPTKSGSKISSDLWVSQVQETAFNEQYTHDTMYEMSTSNYAPADSGIDTNYLCGN